MAFVKLDKGMRRVRDGITEVRLGAYRGKQGRVVYISISAAAIEAAGWTVKQSETNTKRKTVNVMINEGVGDDAGFWLLTEDDEFGYALGADHTNSGALCSSILVARFKHYLLNDEHVSVNPVEATVDEKEHTILVQVPDWIRYNPQSYTEPPKLVLTPPKEDKKPSRPTIRVVVDEEKEEDEPPLNRRQRRLAASVLTKAMR